MPNYEVTMTHTEDSLVALSHMQYDLFCTRNFIAILEASFSVSSRWTPSRTRRPFPI